MSTNILTAQFPGPSALTGAVPTTISKQELISYPTGVVPRVDGPTATLPSDAKFKVPAPVKQHNHYFKDVSKLQTIDVYRVLSLFNVTDPCIQHAVKKLLVAGGRGAGKDINKDIKEAIDSLVRWQEMQAENGQV